MKIITTRIFKNGKSYTTTKNVEKKNNKPPQNKKNNVVKYRGDLSKTIQQRSDLHYYENLVSEGQKDLNKVLKLQKQGVKNIDTPYGKVPIDEQIKMEKIYLKNHRRNATRLFNPAKKNSKINRNLFK